MKFQEVESYQKRKSSKPLTERRRRERINSCLSELKSLVLRGTNKEEHIKMEKADILETTVRYLQDQIQRREEEEYARQQLAIQSFIQGYTTCVNEVKRSAINPCSGQFDFQSTLTHNLLTSLNTTPEQLSLSHTQFQQISPILPCVAADDRLTNTPPNSPTDAGVHQHVTSTPSGATCLTTMPCTVSLDHRSKTFTSSTLTEHRINDSGLPASPTLQDSSSTPTQSGMWRPW